MQIQNKAEIISGLTEVITSVNQLFETIDDDTFYKPIGEKWSPAEHLHHLYVSAKAVVDGLKMPKLVFYAFGTVSTSRSFDEVVNAYKQALVDGAKASGKFVPKNTTNFDRVVLLSKWNSLSKKFETNLENWNEKQLDKYRMPHPILGKLTVREMLFFTIYHTNHHKSSLQQQLSAVQA